MKSPHCSAVRCDGDRAVTKSATGAGEKNARERRAPTPRKVPSDRLAAYDVRQLPAAMRTLFADLPAVASQALDGVLRAKGFELGDFELDEDARRRMPTSSA